MGLHSRLGTCLDLCVRLVHTMDTANNVRTCDISCVYSVYTYSFRVYKVRERGEYREYIGGKGDLGNSIGKVGQVGTYGHLIKS